MKILGTISVEERDELVSELIKKKGIPNGDIMRLKRTTNLLLEIVINQNKDIINYLPEHILKREREYIIDNIPTFDCINYRDENVQKIMFSNLPNVFDLTTIRNIFRFSTNPVGLYKANSKIFTKELLTKYCASYITTPLEEEPSNEIKKNTKKLEFKTLKNIKLYISCLFSEEARLSLIKQKKINKKIFSLLKKKYKYEYLLNNETINFNELYYYHVAYPRLNWNQIFQKRALGLSEAELYFLYKATNLNKEIYYDYIKHNKVSNIGLFSGIPEFTPFIDKELKERLSSLTIN